MKKYSRIFSFPEDESFFLFGPRGTGKTYLKQTYPDAMWIDLLQPREERLFSMRPELLEERLQVVKGFSHVVIDEIQKVPDLLDEVHALIEDRKISFALCGSSARKLKRGHANLLGGRALRYELLIRPIHRLYFL